MSTLDLQARVSSCLTSKSACAAGNIQGVVGHLQDTHRVIHEPVFSHGLVSVSVSMSSWESERERERDIHI